MVAPSSYGGHPPHSRYRHIFNVTLVRACGDRAGSKERQEARVGAEATRKGCPARTLNFGLAPGQKWGVKLISLRCGAAEWIIRG
jgi:hypothetical protein